MSNEHVTSVRTYVIVFLSLMVLLAVSVITGQLELGRWGLAVAMVISVTKTVLVVLFFMHVLHSSNLTRLLAAASVLWLIFLVLLTFADYETREWVVPGDSQYRGTALDRTGSDYLDRSPDF